DELTPSKASEDEDFGATVALSGTTLAVGAVGYSPNSDSYGVGAVYVYSDASGSWKQSAMLVIPHGIGNYQPLGRSVSISGDTIVASGTDTSTKLGAEFVYSDASGSWKQVQELTVSGQNLSSVAVSGTTIAASAAYETVDGNLDEGVVYVFTATDGTWSQSDTIDPENAAEGDALGTCGLALSGDNLAIGSPYSNGVAGEVWIFNDSSGDWEQTGDLAPSVMPADGGDFGCSMALSGTTFVGGAPKNSVNGTSLEGDALVYSDASGSWTPVATLDGKDAGSTSWDGSAVSVSGGTILISADDQTVSSNTDQGSAYVFGSCEEDSDLTDGSWQVGGCFDEPDATDYDASGTSYLDGMPIVPSTKSDVVDYSTGGKSGDSLDTSGATSLSLNTAKISGGKLPTVELTKLLPKNINLGKPVTISLPKAFNWPGPSISGSITFTANKDGSATGVATGKLPASLGGGTATITVTTQAGKGVTSIVATAVEGSAGNFFKVKALKLTYASNTWTIDAIGATATSPPPRLTGTLVYADNGTVASGVLQLTAGTLANLFRLDAIKLSYTAKTSTWTVDAIATSGDQKQTLNGTLTYASNGSLSTGSLTIHNVLVAGLILLKTFQVTYAAGKGWSASADLAQGDQAAQVSMSFTNDGQLVAGSLSASGVTLFQVFKLTLFQVSYEAAKDAWSLKIEISGGKSGSTTKAELSVVGGQVTGAAIHFTNISLLGKVTLKVLDLSYTTPHGDDVFSGHAELQLPGTLVSGVAGDFTFVNGSFSSGSITLSGNVPLYGGVYLTELRAKLALGPPEEIGGGASLSAGPETSAGRLLGFDGDFDYVFANPKNPAGVYTFTGTLSALKNTLGQAVLTVDQTGIDLKVTFGENGQGFKIGKIVTVNGTITGHLVPATSSFSARGTVEFVFSYKGHSINASGVLSASNRGLTACAPIASLSKKGDSGIAYEWGGTPVIKIGDCAPGNFGPMRAVAGSPASAAVKQLVSSRLSSDRRPAPRAVPVAAVVDRTASAAVKSAAEPARCARAAAPGSTTAGSATARYSRRGQFHPISGDQMSAAAARHSRRGQFHPISGAQMSASTAGRSRVSARRPT
ncbi:MAG TPA: FG-GAP repeat protein, partial [Acidimicrobiales bacterium]|nr:FG-GAP repeat protein [Acidimicrobiales bacterium]